MQFVKRDLIHPLFGQKRESLTENNSTSVGRRDSTTTHPSNNENVEHAPSSEIELHLQVIHYTDRGYIDFVM